MLIETPKKGRLMKTIILLISIIALFSLLLFLSGGYGIVTIIEVVKMPFRIISEKTHHSPFVPEYAHVDYEMRNSQFSTRSPFVVFEEPVKFPFYADYNSARTGLFNLETKEATILAPDNGIPKNSSMFSPNGKLLLYAVARPSDTDMFTNENGTWRTIYGFDLYVRDLYLGKSTLVSKNDNPLWISKPSLNPTFFGWIDNDQVYYTCTNSKKKNGIEDYCLTSLDTKTFQHKIGLYGDLPTEIQFAPKDEWQKENIENYDGYNKSQTVRVRVNCEFEGYDGCPVPSVHLVEMGKESRLLFNSRETPYILRWSYDEKLYGLLLKVNSTSVYRLY